MTMYYTRQEQEYLNQKAAGLNSVDLIMCSDGNYRTAEEKAVFEMSRLPRSISDASPS